MAAISSLWLFWGALLTLGGYYGTSLTSSSTSNTQNMVSGVWITFKLVDVSVNFLVFISLGKCVKGWCAAYILVVSLSASLYVYIYTPLIYVHYTHISPTTHSHSLYLPLFPFYIPTCLPTYTISTYLHYAYIPHNPILPSTLRLGPVLRQGKYICII